MALYHLHAKMVQRSKGQSVVAKAAYNGHVRLKNEKTDKQHDYLYKGKTPFSGVFVPKKAPAWAQKLGQSRQALWSHVEKRERRKDSQLAKEIEIALPHELTDKQREYLVKDFVRENFVRSGLIADVSIHKPSKSGDARNHHAHILLTTRKISADDFGLKLRELDTKGQLRKWRENWAHLTNRHLERHGHAVRVDHRTLEEQGIDREATVHLGPDVTALERDGIKTDRGALNRNIEKINHQLNRLNEVSKTIERAQKRYDQHEKGQDYKKGELMEWERDLDDPIKDEEARVKKVLKDEKKQVNKAIKAEEKQTKDAVKDEAARIKTIEKKQEEQFKEQAAEQIKQAGEMQRLQQSLDAYKADLSKQAQGVREAPQDSRANEGDISNAHYRYGQALGSNYDIRDPYRSLARSAMAEYGVFMRERQNIDRQISKASDPQERQGLELRKRIEAAEYMEITSKRIARQSENITGKTNSPEAIRQRERAESFHKEAQSLRKEYRELSASRADDGSRDKAAQKRDEPFKKDIDLDVEKFMSRRGSAPPFAEKARDDTPLKSSGAQATKQADIKDFANTLLSDPQQGKEDDIFAKKNREIALGRIANDFKNGQVLDKSNLRYLSRDDLRNIKKGGEKSLREMARQHERTREQDRVRGR